MSHGTKFKDALGDEFVAYCNGDRVTVMRGCSVVMDAKVVGCDLAVSKSHDTAPSALAVRVALGLVKSEPEPAPPAPVAEKPQDAPRPKKPKPLTVHVGKG